MNVNEEIVENWLKFCKNQFTMSNIKFKVVGKKGGSNYSDIDILAVDSNGIYHVYEIKWRSKASLTKSNSDDRLNNIFNQILRKERDKISEIIRNSEYHQYFITTRQYFGKTDVKKDFFTKEFQKRNIGILYFEDILKELIDRIPIKGSYDSAILQTIRMLKYYNLIKA